MKILLAAIVLTIAAPAAAQAAPTATDPHAGHAMPADSPPGDKSGDAAHKCCCDKAVKDGAADAHAGHDMSKK